MVRKGLIRAKPVRDRVRKLEHAFGPGAVSKQVGEGAWVVLGNKSVVDTPNAAYVAEEGVVRVNISDNALHFTTGKAPVHALRAIFDAMTE